MKLYEHFNEQLAQNLIDTMKQNDISFNLNSCEDERYVTIFIYNKDIDLPKKYRTKARLAKPMVDVFYTRARNFDYKTVSTYEFKKENPEAEIKPINFLWGDLENMNEFADIKAHIVSLSRILFTSATKLCADRFGTKLALMPVELYIPNFKGMYVSKLPSVEYLLHIEKNSSGKTTESVMSYIEKLDNSMSNSPFFTK